MMNRKKMGMKQPMKPVPFKTGKKKGSRINQVSGGGSE